LSTATPRPTHYAESARHAFLDGLPESFDSPDKAIRAGYRSITDWCDLLERYRDHPAHTDLETQLPALPRVTRPRPRTRRNQIGTWNPRSSRPRQTHRVNPRKGAE
jgi:hypothetical protein